MRISAAGPAILTSQGFVAQGVGQDRLQSRQRDPNGRATGWEILATNIDINGMGCIESVRSLVSFLTFASRVVRAESATVPSDSTHSSAVMVNQLCFQVHRREHEDSGGLERDGAANQGGAMQNLLGMARKTRSKTGFRVGFADIDELPVTEKLIDALRLWNLLSAGRTQGAAWHLVQKLGEVPQQRQGQVEFEFLKSLNFWQRGSPAKWYWPGLSHVTST